MWSSCRRYLSEGTFTLTVLIVGVFVCMIGIAPVMAEPTDGMVDDAVDCGDYMIVLTKGKTPPSDLLKKGACVNPYDWPQGSAPPAGAIQVNPVGDLPPDAVCAATDNNICSSQGSSCAPGKTCKDTWDSVTQACMCQCRR